MTSQQAQAMRALLGMFIEAVKAGGSSGAPGGVLYSAVMDKLTLNQFNQIMAALVATNKVRKSGDLYFFVADL